MNDCVNAEIRDRLPDLLHDQLGAQARAVVMAHVEGCVDCRAELELLRGIRETLARRAPAVDVNWVAAALPKPPLRGVAAGRQTSATARRRVWSDWRVAAAVTLFVVGGSSVVVLNHGREFDPMSADTVRLPAAPVVDSPRATPAVAESAASTTRTVAATAEDDNAPMPGTGRRLENLNEQQLKALLNDIDQMKAVPITDPDPVTLRVDGRGSATPEEP